jgi:hypothetical protein
MYPREDSIQALPGALQGTSIQKYLQLDYIVIKLYYSHQNRTGGSCNAQRLE